MGKQDSQEPGPKKLSFGEYLRRQRMLRGISQDEILKVTKIQSNYFQALEANRLQELPPKTFVVGFLKSIARHLGMDENDVINRYLAELVEQEVTINENVMVGRRVPKRSTKLIWFVLGAVMLVALILMPYFLNR